VVFDKPVTINALYIARLISKISTTLGLCAADTAVGATPSVAAGETRGDGKNTPQAACQPSQAQENVSDIFDAIVKNGDRPRAVEKIVKPLKYEHNEFARRGETMAQITSQEIETSHIDDLFSTSSMSRIPKTYERNKNSSWFTLSESMVILPYPKTRHWKS
jgi:hypothetical protein